MEIRPTTKRSAKQKLLDRLHDPLQLRLVLCATLLAAWYWLGYSPMSDRIARTTANLRRDRQLLALATEVESLRAEADNFAHRLPPPIRPQRVPPVRPRWRPNRPARPRLAQPAGPEGRRALRGRLGQDRAPGEIQGCRRLLPMGRGQQQAPPDRRARGQSDSREPELLKVQLSVVGLMGVEAKPEPPKGSAKEATPSGNPAPKKTAPPAAEPAGKPASRTP